MSLIWEALRGRVGGQWAIAASIIFVATISAVVGYAAVGVAFDQWSGRAAIVAFLIPSIVAPPFIISRIRLTERLRRGQRELEERSRQLAETRDRLGQQVVRFELAEAARRDGEARYRALLDDAIQGVCIHRGFKPLYCNAAFAAMFGFASPKEVIVLDSLLVLFDPATHATLRIEREALKNAVRISGDAAERQAIRRNGTVCWVESVSSLVDWDGEPAVQLAAIDVSERRSLERLKGEFISVVSHELRTPLTSIKGSLDLVASGMAGETPPKVASLVGIASANSDRLLRLVNDILDIERIEAGGVTFRGQALSARECLEQAVRENAGFGEQAGARLELVAPEIDLSAFADPDRLQQVLTNLISNAAKVSPKGETVQVTAVPAPDGGVRFQVSDRGPGVPHDFRDRIFQKFTRADAPYDRVHKGTGLGLAIAKTLVERQGGAIGFQSRHGGGTTFFADFPAPRTASR